MTFKERLFRLGFTSYDEYLQAEHWTKFKDRYRDSAMPQSCMVCGQKPVELHHHTYDHLGSENLQDVTPLCGNHHEHVHLILRKKNWGVAKTAAAVNLLRAERPAERPAERIQEKPIKNKTSEKWKRKNRKKELRNPQTRRERRQARQHEEYVKRGISDQEQKSLIAQFKELQRRGSVHPDVPPNYKMRMGDQNMVRYLKLLWKGWNGQTGQRNRPKITSLR